MTLTKTASSVVTKAARVALVFLLVFFTSWHAEYALAFQDDGLSEHGPNTLVGLTVYQVNPADESLLGSAVRSVAQTAKGDSYVSPEVAAGDTVKFVAVASWSDAAASDGIVRTASFVKWKVDGGAVDAPSGVLSFSSSEAGSHEIACELSSAASEYVADSFAAEHPGKPFQASFAVTVAAAETDDAANGESGGAGEGEQRAAPVVSPFEILGVDGNPINNTLSLEADTSYQFDAQLIVKDGLTSEVLYTYRQSDDESGLSAVTGGMLSDVEWSVSQEAEGIASIDEGGKLVVTGDGEFKVLCTTAYQPPNAQQGGSQDEAETQVWSASVNVKAGGGRVEDPQGDDHSAEVQTLRVVADLGIAPSVDGDADTNGDALPTGETQSSSAASEPAPEGEAEEGEPNEGDEDAPEHVLIDKTYSLDELAEKFDQGEGTFTMAGEAGPVTVTGAGVWLSDLLEDAGVDPASVPIESIDFVNFEGVSTRVSWADLLEGTLSPTKVLVASSSRVHLDGEASQGQDGAEGESEAAADELLPNTRFRVLFDSSLTTVDPSALRWISAIQVNVEQPKPPAQNDVFSVSVSYVPVPVGVPAVFVAVPSYTINGRWDCLWEESADGGKTWTKIEGSEVQTLRIPTTADRVGHQFRVTIDTNIKDDETGEFLAATSDPVTMQEGSGFSVVLAYDPPLAGSTAIFQSSILGYDGDLSDVNYFWELTYDGGASWLSVKDALMTEDEIGPTLNIPTEAVPDEGMADEVSSSDESAINLIYIRVTASAPNPADSAQPYKAVSNMQPLTVRVGDSGTQDGSGDVPNMPSDASEGAIVDNVDDSGGQTTPPQPVNPVVVTEVESLVVEDVASGMADVSRPDPTSDVNPADVPQPAAAQIYINDQVAEQITEQQQTVEQYVQSTQPGARWTSLNTVAPEGDDVSAVLADNPFAPFVVPLALGITASGVVEKLVAFRRQLL